MVDMTAVRERRQRMRDEAAAENANAVASESITLKATAPAPTQAPEAPSEEVSLFDDLLSIPTQIFGGAEEALINQGRFLKSGVGFLGQNFSAFEGAEEFIDSLPNIPQVPEAPGPVSGAFREISQFLTGMVLPAQKLKAASAFVRGALAGGASGATAFEPHEPGTASAVRDLAQNSEAAEGFFRKLPQGAQKLLEWLPVVPEDSEVMARIKKFSAEIFVGVPFEVVMQAARTLRAVRHAKKLEDGKKSFDPDAVKIRRDLVDGPDATKSELREAVRSAEQAGGGSVSDVTLPDLAPQDITQVGLKVNEKTGLFHGAEKAFVDVKSMSLGGKKINLKELGLDLESSKDTAALIRKIKSSIKGIEKQIGGKVPGAASKKRAARTVFEEALEITRSGEEGLSTAFESALRSTNRTELDKFFFDVLRAHHGNQTYALVQRTAAGDLAAASQLPRQLAIGAEIESLSRVIKSPMSKSLNDQFDLSSFGFGRNFNKEATDMLVRNAKYVDSFDAADIAARLKTLENPQQFRKLMQQMSRPTMFDAFLETYYNSILSSSVVPNFIGSHAFLVYQMPVRLLAGVYGTAGKLLSGKLDASPLMDSVAFAGGYARSFMNNIWTLNKNLAKSAVGLDPSIAGDLQKFEAFGQNAIRSETFSGSIEAADKAFRLATRDGISVKTPLEWLTNVTGRFTRITQNLFASADEFNRRIAYDADRWSRGHRTLFDTPSGKQAGKKVNAVVEHTADEGIDHSAEEFGRFITFTREAEATAGLRDLLNEYPAARLVIPFLRSQADMFSAWVANSPLAVASPTFKKAMAAGGAERQIALSQLTLGSALTYSLWEGWSAGKITGDGPSDHKELAMLKKTGWRPRSLLVDGDSPMTHALKMASGRDDLFDRPLKPPVYVSYNDVQPFSVWMATVVNSLETAQRMEDPSESDSAFKMIYEDVAVNVLDRNFLKGLFTIVGGFNGGREGQNVIPNLTASLAPAIVADFQQAGRKVPIDFKTIDPTLSPEHQAMKKVFQKFKFRLGFDEDAIPNYDGLGQLGIRPNASWTSLFNIDISGKMTSKFADVYGHFLNNRYFPQKLDNHISHAGVRIPLTMEQYDEYQRIYGSSKMGGFTLMERLKGLTESEAFLGASDGEDGIQRKVLESTVEAYREGAKGLLVRKNPDLLFKLKSEKRRQVEEAQSSPTFDLEGVGDNTTKDVLSRLVQ